MTNTNIVRCYAASHGDTIVRKDFMSWFGSEYPDGSVRSIDTELRQMVADGVLERTGFGQFRMLPEEKPPYIPVVSPEMKEHKHHAGLRVNRSTIGITVLNWICFPGASITSVLETLRLARRKSFCVIRSRLLCFIAGQR